MIPMGQIWVEIMIGGIWANWIKIAPSDPPGQGLKLRILFPNTTVEVGIIGRNNRCFAEIKTGFPEFILAVLVLLSRDSLYFPSPTPFCPSVSSNQNWVEKLDSLRYETGCQIKEWETSLISPYTRIECSQILVEKLKVPKSQCKILPGIPAIEIFQFSQIFRNLVNKIPAGPLASSKFLMCYCHDSKTTFVWCQWLSN